MIEDFLLFAVGCACAALGGELFVHGLVGLANWGRLPKGVVAATLGAFATSSPELVVAITAASQGLPEIALGDALGSNIVNVTLILAIPLMMFGVVATRDSVTRDLPFAVAIFPILGLAALDGTIDGSEALILYGVFSVWLVSVVLFAIRNRAEAGEGMRDGAGMVAASTVIGLLMLILAGQLIVSGATGLAAAIGLPAFLIGATVVALGTSVPELATVVVSTLRGHREVGLQTILGSNIFNCLFIVSTAAILHPISVEWNAVTLALGAGLMVTLLTVPVFSFRLGRWRGFVLVAAYAAFIALSMSTAGLPAH